MRPGEDDRFVSKYRYYFTIANVKRKLKVALVCITLPANGVYVNKNKWLR